MILINAVVLDTGVRRNDNCFTTLSKDTSSNCYDDCSQLVSSALGENASTPHLLRHTGAGRYLETLLQDTCSKANQ